MLEPEIAVLFMADDVEQRCVRTGSTAHATVGSAMALARAVVPPKPGLEWRLLIWAIIAQTPPDRYTAICAYR